MVTGFKDVELGTVDAVLENRDDHSQILRTRQALSEFPETILERLDHWANIRPEQTFVAQRDNNGQWQRYSYAQTLKQVKAIAQALLNRNLTPERPIAILSGNSIEHLMMALGAMYVGIPYAPISPAYSLISKDYSKAKYICNLLTPGLFLVDKASAFEPVLKAVNYLEAEVVAIEADTDDASINRYQTLLDTQVMPAVEEHHAAVNADTIAKFLFTSGSTGSPKGVINTNRMMCSNQEMLLSLMPFMKNEPPVLLDWLPWNHTFGGNHNVGIVLYNGGSLYLDDGKPVPGLFERTLNNLKEISPTIYFNVPKGFEMLVHQLQKDEALRESFYAKLNLMFFAGAGLSQHVWDQLDEMAIKTVGAKIGMLTGLGATETSPAALFASLEESASGVIGLPAVGVELKLVPNEGKLECRVKGPNVMPGYWRQPELNKKCFDEDGFYCIGDAVKFIDPNDIQRGLLFDGRISEDFKLDTGTWVSVGPLRANIITTGAPYVQDVVVSGINQSYVSIGVFPVMTHCRDLSRLSADASDEDVLNSAPVKEYFVSMLSELKKKSTGSSNRVERLVLLAEPPQLDAHEITDKGSINQRALLENRAELFSTLYSENPPGWVLSCQ